MYWQANKSCGIAKITVSQKGSCRAVPPLQRCKCIFATQKCIHRTAGDGSLHNCTLAMGVEYFARLHQHTMSSLSHALLHRACIEQKANDAAKMAVGVVRSRALTHEYIHLVCVLISCFSRCALQSMWVMAYLPYSGGFRHNSSREPI